MSQHVWNLLVALWMILLGVLTLLLLTRGRLWARKAVAIEENAGTAKADTPYSGIDPSDHADAAEQQAALNHLSELPQFRRLQNGTLIEWGSGARITPCDCRLPPVPHLMISWGPKHAQAIVSKKALAHYIAYQEHVADALVALLAVRVVRQEGAADTGTGIALKGGR